MIESQRLVQKLFFFSAFFWSIISRSACLWLAAAATTGACGVVAPTGVAVAATNRGVELVAACVVVVVAACGVVVAVVGVIVLDEVVEVAVGVTLE